MSLKYAVYARKSQEDEGRQVQSIDNQIDETNTLAEREQLAVVETFSEARSAWEPENRPEFARLIKKIERGEIEGIIAWHPDRLSRNETDGATITRLLRKGKLKDLRFASYHFVNSPEGIMMLQIALSQSQYQNSKMAVDVRRGMQRKRDTGWYPHRPPVGYLNDFETRTIIPDPERFDLVRKGWDLLLGGHLTVMQVTEAMNEMGLRTKQRRRSGGGPLAPFSGYALFANPFYTGRFLSGGVMYIGKHTPMVTMTEFDRAQELINKKGRPHGRHHSFPYSGLIRCTRCGWGATTELKHGSNNSGTYIYLHCSNRKCDQHNARQDRMEADIERTLAALRLDDEARQLASAELESWQAEEVTAQERVGEERQEAIVEAEQALDRLTDLLIRGVVDESHFRSKRDALRYRIAQLQRARRETDARRQLAGQSIQNAIEFGKLALALFCEGDQVLRRWIVETLALKISIDGGVIDVHLHPLFRWILSSKTGQTEPPKSGFYKAKKTSMRTPSLLGAGDDNFSELLSIAAESPPIPDIHAFLRVANWRERALDDSASPKVDL